MSLFFSRTLFSAKRLSSSSRSSYRAGEDVVDVGLGVVAFAAAGPFGGRAALYVARVSAGGYALAQAGVRLQQHYPGARLRARSHFCLASVNTHWFEPLEHSVEQSRLAYRWAVEAGDTEQTLAERVQTRALIPDLDVLWCPHAAGPPSGSG